MRSCLILGAGRSGTSMVAGALRDAGYYMGSNGVPVSDGNPHGYFETFEINDINEDLLAPVVRLRARRRRVFWKHPRLGRSQHWLSVLPRGLRLQSSIAVEQRIRAAVSHGPFCFKDPRFSYTLPAWQPHVDDALRVCVFREPAKTVNSILKDCKHAPYLASVNMTYSWGMKLWVHMYANVLDELSLEGEWLFLHYDQVLHGDGLDRLAQLLGCAPDRSFPERGLDRSPATGRTTGRIRRLYRRLCERAGYAEKPKDPP